MESFLNYSVLNDKSLRGISHQNVLVFLISETNNTFLAILICFYPFVTYEDGIQIKRQLKVEF